MPTDEQFVIEPQWPIVIFGCGCQGRIVHERMGLIDDYGTHMTEITFMPTNEMMQYYGLSKNNLNALGLITRQYPTSKIIQLNNDPIINSKMILCDFEWNDTPLTRNFPKTDLLESYEKELRRLKAEIASKDEELIQVVSRQTEYYDKYLGKLFVAIKKITGKTRDEEDFGITTPEEMEYGG